MSSWSRAKTTGPLTPPCRYQMAHDLVGSTLYVHGGGGQGSATQQRRSLLWSLDLQTLAWTERVGPRPRARAPPPRKIERKKSVAGSTARASRW